MTRVREKLRRQGFADPIRCAGSCQARRRRSFTAGTEHSHAKAVCGVDDKIRLHTALIDSPANGEVPVIISYNLTPNEKMSDRASCAAHNLFRLICRVPSGGVSFFHGWPVAPFKVRQLCPIVFGVQRLQASRLREYAAAITPLPA